MPTAAPLDPTTYNSATVGVYTLGQVVEYLGAWYRFFYFVGTQAAGDVCVYYASTTGYQVIGANRATALVGTPAGTVTAGVVPVGGGVTGTNYGFLQIRGIHTNVKGVATVTLQALQMASGTNDSGVDWTGVVKPFGTALTTISGGRYTVDINV